MILGQIVNGLVIGAMYALIALGYTLVLGSLHRLNLAHPEVLMVGGFVGVVMANYHLPIFVGLPAALIVGAIGGLIVEAISFRRLHGEDAEVGAALSSVAVGVVIVDVVQKIWGTEPVPLDQTGVERTFEFVGVRFTTIQLSVVGIAAALMIALHLLVTRTSLGRQIRAVADNSNFAPLFGVDVSYVTRSVFALSSALACAAGYLIAVRLGAANSDIGLAYGLKALAVMAIGGMGDLRGAVLGGLVVGVLESIATQFGLGRMTDALVWLCLIAILILRPQGLLGRALQESRA